VQDAQDGNAILILPEIHPVAAEQAEAQPLGDLFAGAAAVAEAGEALDMIEKAADETLGGNEVGLGDIVEDTVEIAECARRKDQVSRSNRPRPLAITVCASAPGSSTARP
jgi:hypothetical protein